MRILEPAYLQLVGLSLPDDRDVYLRAGNHLRWFPHPKLGFPRRGFRLLRRRSVVLGLNWGKRRDRREANLANMQQQGIQWQEQAAGLIVTGGFSVVGTQPRLSGTTTLKFLRPTSFDTLAPAAAVRITLSGQLLTQLTATAYFSSPGPNASVVLDSFSGSLSALSAQRDGTRSLTLTGGLIDQVTLQVSSSVALVQLEWIDAQLTSDNTVVREWEPLKTFWLPIQGDGQTYPSRSLREVQSAVAEQLQTMAPKALSPAVTALWPPARLAVPHPMVQSLTNQTAEVGQLVTQLLSRELSENVSQDQLRLEGDLTSADGTPESGGMPMLDLMLAGAIDPMMAALLGLTWRDEKPGINQPLSELQVDYLLEADYPLANLPLDLSIWGLDASTRRVPEMDLAKEAGAGFFTAIALLPGMGLSSPVAVSPPAEFLATLMPAAGRRPVPAEVALSWSMVDAADIRLPGRIASALRRDDGVEDISLEPMNPDTQQPFLRLKNEAAGRFVDRQLRTEKEMTYRIHVMDLFGRWSMPARTTVEVRDLVPPPPPSGLTGELTGELTEDQRPENTYETLTLTFDWTPTHAVRAPDATNFRIHLKAGSHTAVAVQSQPDKSGSLSASGTAHDVHIASVDRVLLSDGRQQYSVVIRNVPVTTLAHVSTLSVIVVARDSRGNTSRPTRAAIIRAVEAVVLAQPSVPEEILLTTWADAEGIGICRLIWPALPPGSRLQVVTASAARLLALAGEPEDSLDGLPQNAQAQRLRMLAIQHPPAFSPDHPRPYPHSVTDHDVKVRAADRSLRLALLRPTGPTGMLSPWPTDPRAFAIISTRGTPLNQPLNLVVRAGESGVTIIAKTMTQSIAQELRLYRTTSAAVAGDIRAMRPLPPIAMPDATDEISIPDNTVEIGQWYAYCGIALGQNGSSTPVSGPIWVYVPV